MVYYERDLPHWFPEGKHVFVTWRLHGSLPLAVLEELHRDTLSPKGKRFTRFDSQLDRAAFGPRWLAQCEIAELVESEILGIAETEWGRIDSYVVMPNHVHVLLEPNIEMKTIMKAIKRRSARACNSVLGRQNLPFWQAESFDHWVRTAESLGRIQRYIEWNPVSAGLVKKPEDWPWSSAHKVAQASACEL
jgi:putative transposase